MAASTSSSSGSLPAHIQAQLSCAAGTRVVEQLPGLEEGGWARQPCVLGIDEAGRGPALGPMVYAAAFAPASLNLKTEAFADSKALTAEARETLFARICSAAAAPGLDEDQPPPGDPARDAAPAGAPDGEAAPGPRSSAQRPAAGVAGRAPPAPLQVGWCSELLSAAFISAGMLGATKTSLNALAMESTSRIIRRLLDRGVNLTEVYVDTIGDAERYQQRLQREFPALSFTVCPKADALYPIVSAASIVAKVLRDAALLQAARDDGVGGSGGGASASAVAMALGTGYPSDPATKQWLKGNVDRVWGYRQSALVRFSWEPVVRQMAEGGCVPVSWEADDESGGGGGGSGQQQRLNLGSKRLADVVETSGVGRHAYFRARRLQRVAELF